MPRGCVYLVAVLDWASRRVLSWGLSNTLTTDFCLEAVQEAITQYGTPAIFNTDQGCQFTSLEFTGLLKDQGVQISMDGQDAGVTTSSSSDSGRAAMASFTSQNGLTWDQAVAQRPQDVQNILAANWQN